MDGDAKDDEIFEFVMVFFSGVLDVGRHVDSTEELVRNPAIETRRRESKAAQPNVTPTLEEFVVVVVNRCRPSIHFIVRLSTSPDLTCIISLHAAMVSLVAAILRRFGTLPAVAEHTV